MQRVVFKISGKTKLQCERELSTYKDFTGTKLEKTDGSIPAISLDCKFIICRLGSSKKVILWKSNS